MKMADPLERYEFGQNWLVFLRSMNEDRIVEAEKCVRHLTGLERLDGKTFLDIGSGSGIMSLAAHRLGAIVHSFDFDQDCVAGTQMLKEQYAPLAASWTIERGSVLDTDYMQGLGQYDVAFSWGVLHHTGAMYDAIRNAAATTKPDGQFIFALYRKTPFCGLWKAEKKWFIGASPRARRLATKLYIGLFRLAFLVRGRDFKTYVETNHVHMRGMEFETAVQDWIGGYPYESISKDEVAALMATLNFEYVRGVIAPRTLSVLGSGCDEFVYRPATSTRLF